MLQLPDTHGHELQLYFRKLPLPALHPAALLLPVTLAQSAGWHHGRRIHSSSLQRIRLFLPSSGRRSLLQKRFLQLRAVLLIKALCLSIVCTAPKIISIFYFCFDQKALKIVSYKKVKRNHALLGKRSTKGYVINHGAFVETLVSIDDEQIVHF